MTRTSRIDPFTELRRQHNPLVNALAPKPVMLTPVPEGRDDG